MLQARYCRLRDSSLLECAALTLLDSLTERALSARSKLESKKFPYQRPLPELRLPNFLSRKKFFLQSSTCIGTWIFGVGVIYFFFSSHFAFQNSLSLRKEKMEEKKGGGG